MPAVSIAEASAIAEAVKTGAALHQRGMLADAEKLYAGVLKLAPDHFDALHLLGVVRHQQGKDDEALGLIAAALEVNAASADALNNYGRVLLQVRRFDEALAILNKALALDPRHGSALVNRAAVRIALGQFGEALADTEHALRINDGNANAWCKRGTVLAALEQPLQAIESHDRALAINPRLSESLNNRACLLGDIGKTEEALAGLDALVTADPDYAKGWLNRGHMLVGLHREDEAIASYDRACTIAQHPDAMFNAGINRLRLGDFQRGWEGYEWRWQVKDYQYMRRSYPHPRWNGASLQGTLLVSAEQGLGDQLLFAGMLPDLLPLVGSVVAEVEGRLIPLFARSFPGIKWIALQPELYSGAADAEIPICSLGRYLRPAWNAFPVREHGYLRSDPALAARLRARLADGRTVVGLSWHSRNPRYQASKSIDLHDFATLLQLPGCRFIDLQYGDTSLERAAVERDLGVRVERLPDIDNTDDLDGLAALIVACDLVVTASNTTAHLAGALGKEAHVLLPWGRGRIWYWFKDRDDSPWYPRVRLKRQQRGQPWTELIAGVAAEFTSRKR